MKSQLWHCFVCYSCNTLSTDDRLTGESQGFHRKACPDATVCHMLIDLGMNLGLMGKGLRYDMVRKIHTSQNPYSHMHFLLGFGTYYLMKIQLHSQSLFLISSQLKRPYTPHQWQLFKWFISHASIKLPLYTQLHNTYNTSICHCTTKWSHW
jgi:hypothetical protein